MLALITGGSRGVGADTARALAKQGYDVVITYRNKAARANEIVSEISQNGIQALAVGSDMTNPADVEQLIETVRAWGKSIDVLVLNASGGMEREALALDPEYPIHINRDAQLSLLEKALPLMSSGSTVVFVTSHWAHLYGQVVQVPTYEPVAQSKHAGETELRARQQQLAERGIRLVVVTGDLIEGTITAKLMERSFPGLAAYRRTTIGALPSTRDMGEAIAQAVTDASIESGHTVVVGGSLDSFARID